jgi:hypothetical protein
VSALHSALSAIGNAEAIRPPPGMPGAGNPHIAGAVAGFNTGEVRRRTLSAAEVNQIIQAEISERLLAARDYERSGHTDRAQRLPARRAFSPRLHRVTPHTVMELANHHEISAPSRL